MAPRSTLNNLGEGGSDITRFRLFRFGLYLTPLGVQFFIPSTVSYACVSMVVGHVEVRLFLLVFVLPVVVIMVGHHMFYGS